MKIKKKKNWSFCENSKKKFGGGGGSGGVRGGGRGPVGGVRVDVIEELKFLGNFTKKIQEGVGWGGGVGLGGQGGCK